MRVRQDTAPHLFAVESETDSEQWYQVFANGRSEEHTSELQSPCNLVCRLIISEEHTSELQSPCNLVCRLLFVKKYGTANSRLHFHAVHFMRTLPTGSVDPNFCLLLRHLAQLK